MTFSESSLLEGKTAAIEYVMLSLCVTLVGFKKIKFADFYFKAIIFKVVELL